MSSADAPTDPLKDQLPIPMDPETARTMAPLIWNDLNTRHNLNIQDEHESELFLSALGKEDVRLEDMRDKVFSTKWYLAHIVPVTLDDGGEIVMRVRVVLIDPDGRKLAWTTPITSKTWGAILYMRKNGPWNPPLQVRVTAHKGKTVGYWYSLDLAPQPNKSKKGAQ